MSQYNNVLILDTNNCFQDKFMIENTKYFNNTINKCNIFNTIIIKVHNSFIVLSTYTRLQLINVIRTSPDLTL